MIACHAPHPEGSVLDVVLAGTRVRLEAPLAIIRDLEVTLCELPRAPVGTDSEITVSVFFTGAAWHVEAGTGAMKVLPAETAPPRIAGAAATSMIESVATRRGYLSLPACAVVRDGLALLLLGDDWDTAIGLAAHLHVRGWALAGTGHVLFDPHTHCVYSVEKSLYINSSLLSQLPARYQQAVEVAPWFVTPYGIAFYAVNPSLAIKQRTWARPARLAAVAFVDGSILDYPEIRVIGEHDRYAHRLSAIGVDLQFVSAIDLQVGGIVETCDALERWFGQL